MLLIFLLAIIIEKKIIPIFERMQTALDAINRTVRESIIGVRVIRAFNRTQDEKKRVDTAFIRYADIAVKANKIFAALMPLVMMALNIATILILWVGGRQAAARNIGVGDIMAVIEYAMLTLMYLVMGVSVFLFIPRAQTCAIRINEVLKTQPEFSKEPAENAGSARMEVARTVVTFQNVSFRYADLRR